MLHEANPIERSGTPAGAWAFSALLRRLSGGRGGRAAAVQPVSAEAEFGFYALDDVSCVRLERR